MFLCKEWFDGMEVFCHKSRHAVERMKQRNLHDDEIIEILLAAGEELLNHPAGSKVNIISDHCCLVVGVNTDADYNTLFDVITVINERYINAHYENIILN